MRPAPPNQLRITIGAEQASPRQTWPVPQHAAAAAAEIEDASQSAHVDAGFGQCFTNDFRGKPAALDIPACIRGARNQHNQTCRRNWKAVGTNDGMFPEAKSANPFPQAENRARQPQAREYFRAQGLQDANPRSGLRCTSSTHTIAAARATSARAKPANGLNSRCQVARSREKANNTEYTSGLRLKT